MPVALVHCRIAAEEVEVTFSFHVVNEDPFAPAQGDRNGLIVERTVLLLSLYYFHGRGSSSRCRCKPRGPCAESVARKGSLERTHRCHCSQYYWTWDIVRLLFVERHVIGGVTYFESCARIICCEHSTCTGKSLAFPRLDFDPKSQGGNA